LWIEANTLTIEQVTDIMDGKRVKCPKKDITEVKNAILAYDELLECNPHNEKDLLKQHALLMKGLIQTAGRYRTDRVGVFSGKTPIHVAPPAQRVPTLMAELIEWVKTAPLPQVVKSCIFHYEFEFIHPFSDGNGRMGRMWQSLLLYQENQIFAWLPVESIVAQRQNDYYRAIRRSTSNNDSGIFTQFMLTALKDAAIQFREKYEKGEIGGVIGGVNGGVNAFQQNIIDLIKENPHISIVEIANKLDKSRRTIENNIKQLK
jgi:Fic family protein